MASNVFFHLTGGSGNTDPDLSLGGVASGNRLSTTILNNLFDNVRPSEIVAADRVEYRAIDLKNEGDASSLHVDFFFTNTPNAESQLAAWYDSTGTQSIGTETLEPTGASGNWTEPTESSPLVLPVALPASDTHRIWIRRTVDKGAAQIDNESATLHCWFS